MNRLRIGLFVGLTALGVTATSVASPSLGLTAKLKGTTTLAGPVMVVDQNGDGLPNFGDTITFNLTTTQTSQAFVNLACSNPATGSVAYGTDAYFTTTPAQYRNFILSSPAWTSGSADCTATVIAYVSSTRYVTLASLSFHVNA